jgi:hypothetical protein
VPINGISEQLRDIIANTALDQSISASDLRHILRFISEAIEAFALLFQGIYIPLTELQYVVTSYKNNRSSRAQMSRILVNINNLLASSEYWKARELLSRFSALKVEFDSKIAPIISASPDTGSKISEWRKTFDMIIEVRSEFLISVDEMIPNLRALILHLEYHSSQSSVEAVRGQVSTTTEYLYRQLIEVYKLRGQIFGLSGHVGFLELTENSN